MPLRCSDTPTLSGWLYVRLDSQSPRDSGAMCVPAYLRCEMMMEYHQGRQRPCHLQKCTPGLQVRPVTRQLASAPRARVHIKAQLVISATERATSDTGNDANLNGDIPPRACPLISCAVSSLVSQGGGGKRGGGCEGAHVSARRQINFFGRPDRRGSHLCDEEASVFLSHRTCYSSDEAGDSTSGSLVPHDRRPSVHQNVRSAVSHLCSIYLGPSSVVQLCFPPSLKGVVAQFPSCRALSTKCPHHQLQGLDMCVSTQASRKKHKCPKEEELNESGCSTTGTCPTGAPPARVDEHRVCMCNRWLVVLSSHELEMGWRWCCVRPAHWQLFSEGRMMGPQTQLPSSAAAAPVGRQPAISSDLTRRRGVLL